MFEREASKLKLEIVLFQLRYTFFLRPLLPFTSLLQLVYDILCKYNRRRIPFLTSLKSNHFIVY